MRRKKEETRQPRSLHRYCAARTAQRARPYPDCGRRPSRSGDWFAKQARATFTRRVQSEFILNPARLGSSGEFVEVEGRRIPLLLVPNPRARRYVLRLRPDGSARVTIPRGGSLAEGRNFAGRHRPWLARQFQRLATRPPAPSREWLVGTEIHLRGELVKIEAPTDGETGLIRFGSESIKVLKPEADLRRAISVHLWRLAAGELPPRVMEFAAQHGLTVRRITVRNQRSRWGSCSRRGNVSLNWRLIQTPPFVRDYIILHELMHLRQMNHSARFWQEVAGVCPDYEQAEVWLKGHPGLLRGSSLFSVE